MIFWYIRSSNSQKMTACQTLGEARHQLDLQNTEDKSEVIEPVYKWSSQYNTCIYSGGIMKVDLKEGIVTNRHIKDLYTNQDIVAYWETIIFGQEDNSTKTFTTGNQNELEILEKELKP